MNIFSNDKSVWVWTFDVTKTPKLAPEVKYSHTDKVNCLSFNPLTHQVTALYKRILLNSQNQFLNFLNDFFHLLRFSQVDLRITQCGHLIKLISSKKRAKIRSSAVLGVTMAYI